MTHKFHATTNITNVQTNWEDGQYIYNSTPLSRVDQDDSSMNVNNTNITKGYTYGPGEKLGKKIAWCTAAANKLKWKVYMLVWAVFEPGIVSHGALSLDLPGAYSKI
jgi:hypothetical protein